jgi:hypothetical protein
VRQRRFELPCPFEHNDLNVARLPVSPPPQTFRIESANIYNLLAKTRFTKKFITAFFLDAIIENYRLILKYRTFASHYA